MKSNYKWAIVALFAVVLASFVAFGADTNTNRYSANEFSVATFGTYQVSGVKPASGDYGAGIETTYFVTRSLGASLATSKNEVNRGAFFQNLSIAPVIRFPIKNSGLAPYIFGGLGFDFEKSNDRYYFAGAGLGYKFTRHVGAFADGQYVWRASLRGVPDDSALVRAGLRWTF